MAEQVFHLDSLRPYWASPVYVDDPNRIRVRVRMHFTGTVERGVVFKSFYSDPLDFVVVRRSEPMPGTIDTGGQTTFQLGEPIHVRLLGLGRSAAKRGLPEGAVGFLSLALVRLAQALPGDLATPELVVASYDVPLDRDGFTIDLPQDPWREIWTPGPFELRLLDPAGAVVDRLPLDFVLPRVGADALQVEVVKPDQWGVRFPFATFAVNLPASFPEAARRSLALMLFHVGADGALQWVNEADIVDGAAAMVNPEGRGPFNGGYVAHLVLPESIDVEGHGAFSDSGRIPTRYSLASVPFELEGLEDEPASPRQWRDATLSVVSGASVAGGELTVLATPAEGVADFDISSLWLSVHRSAQFGPGCVPILEVGVPGADFSWTFTQVPLSPDGTATVRLPPDLGDYEIRLYEGALPRDYDGLYRYPQNQLVTRLPLHVGISRDDNLIGVAGLFDMFERPVLQIDTDRLPPVQVLIGGVELPGLQPGGAERPFAGMNYFGRPDPRLLSDDLSTSATARTGSFEARLYTVVEQFGPVLFSRREFKVEDRRQPPIELPADAAYTRSLTPAWPAPDDPRQGVAAIRPARGDCEVPVFDSPPTLQLVEWLGGDIESDEDDRYEPVSRLFPGHPYFAQALFGEVPPQDVYRMVVGGRAVMVTRTRDPRLFRSEMIVFTPGGMP